MSISEYVKLRQSAVDEYEKETRTILKISEQSPSAISIMMLAAALEAFGRGFDSAAIKLDPTTPHQ